MQFDVSIVASDLLTGTRSTAPLRAGDYLLDEDETTEGPQGKKPTIVLVADEDLEEANPGECWESGEGGSKRVYIHRGAPVEVLVSALHRLAGKVGA